MVYNKLTIYNTLKNLCISIINQTHNKKIFILWLKHIMENLLYILIYGKWMKNHINMIGHLLMMKNHQIHRVVKLIKFIELLKVKHLINVGQIVYS